jgi:SulP family sulfate permease
MPKVAGALRAAFAEGYDRAALRADLLAGAVVAIVALPLSMALAIAVGVTPEHGLYTAIVAGLVVALLGGSRYQVTGPTAAFVVVLSPIANRHGVEGLLTAGLLAGLMLLAMGAFRLGRLIEFIPHPVTTGFTAGIATVIFALQLKDAAGLEVGKLPDAFPEKMLALWHARGSASLADVAVSVGTLAVLVGFPRLTRKVPAPLVAIVLVALAVAAIKHYEPDLRIATVGSRFHSTVDGLLVPGIPRAPPMPRSPWGSHLSLGYVRELLPAGFAIAMLGAIESLLSAVIADGMTGKRHDPNAELIGLGIGNILAPFFGGIAATGALARTATNVRSGARSPLAAVFHAIFVLLVVLAAAPLVAYVPMASLAALLMLVAWNMSDIQHVRHLLRLAPKSDVFVLIGCYVLTVLFDMVIAVTAGVLFAALLFMRRMAELTQTRVLSSAPTARQGPVSLPSRVVLYEIAGPLFFGAAQQAMRQLDVLGADVSVVIFDLSKVSVIDATGLVALESALDRLQGNRILVILSGPLPKPESVFDKRSLEAHHRNVLFARSIDEAVTIARDLALLSPEWQASVRSA